MILRPHAAENIVSCQRNAWSEEAVAVEALLDGRETGQARLDVDAEGVPRNILQSLCAHMPVKVNATDSAFFVSAGSVRTPLHSDERAGLLFHLLGRKSFVIISPEESDSDRGRLQRILEFRATPGTHSALFTKSFPVPYWRGELEPGDALYIPRRWLHDLESQTPTVSLNLRFGPSLP